MADSRTCDCGKCIDCAADAWSDLVRRSRPVFSVLLSREAVAPVPPPAAPPHDPRCENESIHAVRAMTDETLNEAERLANAATAGPWEHLAGDHVNLGVGLGVPVAFYCAEHKDDGQADADAAFIAAARTLVPELVAEVRRLRAEASALREAALLGELIVPDARVESVAPYRVTIAAENWAPGYWLTAIGAPLLFARGATGVLERVEPERRTLIVSNMTGPTGPGDYVRVRAY